jgi:hypothetical protein
MHSSEDEWGTSYQLEERPAEFQVTIKLPKRIKKLDDVELTVDR